MPCSAELPARRVYSARRVGAAGSLREGRLFSRVRDGLSAGYGRLRTSVWPVLQAAVAASLAYFLAEVVVGHGQPFFAPIAAVVLPCVPLRPREKGALGILARGR